LSGLGPNMAGSAEGLSLLTSSGGRGRGGGGGHGGGSGGGSDGGAEFDDQGRNKILRGDVSKAHSEDNKLTPSQQMLQSNNALERQEGFKNRVNELIQKGGQEYSGAQGKVKAIKKANQERKQAESFLNPGRF